MSKEHLADVAALAENAIIYIQYDKDEDLESMRIITSMSEEIIPMPFAEDNEVDADGREWGN